MRILFTHSYFLRFDAKQWKLGQPYPPYGTILAAACAREAGHEVELFDTQFVSSPNEIKPVIQKFHPEILVIYDDGFNYLTKMCLTKMREAAFQMQKIGKGNKCRVIVCSSDSSDHAKKYLEEGADFVIKGEGERSLLLLLDTIQNKTTRDDIPGVITLRDGELKENPKAEVMKDLDSLPMPAWDLVDMEKYRSVWISHHGYFSLNVATTRGCPYKCNWCAKPIYGNRYNSRSPQKVVQELKMLSEKYQFDHIWFSDDIFGLKPGWVKAFADEVEKCGLKLNYKIQSRADLLVQENYVHDLARSGCTNVWMGAESGSQKILDAMDKGTTIEQIKEATRLLRKHKIQPAFFLQFGYPGETKEDIDNTLALLKEMLPDDAGISVSYPLPGTLFYENVKKDLVTKQNWTDSDDLDLMFKGTFSNSYYRTLHAYAHRYYRKLQGKESVKKIFRSPNRFNEVDLKRAIAWPWHTFKASNELRKLNALDNGRG
ncbi:MAG TPA: radical SAM protein [Bacteroidia bacterium]|jgi:radical SAM superfamily enzyme YgiQ (UPF0313 family)|nr:radical SAM protein [Bacteroidia bacterium]